MPFSAANPYGECQQRATGMGSGASTSEEAGHLRRTPFSGLSESQVAGRSSCSGVRRPNMEVENHLFVMEHGKRGLEK